MKLSKRALLAVCLASAFVTPSWAAEPYVTSKILDVSTLLPPPPVDGSPIDRAELAAVIDLQAHTSDARRAQAVVDAKESIYTLYAPVLGGKFDPANLPATTALFERVGASEGKTIDPSKKIFGRLRPFQAHPEVQGLEPRSTSGSYPSGHATKATLFAIVMSDLLPEKKRELWERAEDYKLSRLIMGMHYQSDLDAGARCGTAIATVMYTLPEFHTALEAARTELRGVLGLPLATTTH